MSLNPGSKSSFQEAVCSLFGCTVKKGPSNKDSQKEIEVEIVKAVGLQGHNSNLIKFIRKSLFFSK